MRDDAQFDEAAFAELVRMAVRVLDNVLDVTVWPLPQQQQEARSERRIGLDLPGRCDALIVPNLRYETDAARRTVRRVVEPMHDIAYVAWSALAAKRGTVPLGNADLHRSGSTFVSRLPAALRERVRAQGLRNSHLLSIAPRGTISLTSHRYAMPGVLEEDGFPLRAMGGLGSAGKPPEPARVLAGKACTECGNASVIHKDGCDFCTACGNIGQCG